MAKTTKKYELKLELYQTIEATNMSDAEEKADYEVSRLTANGLAGDLGYTEAVWSVKLIKSKEGN